MCNFFSFLTNEKGEMLYISPVQIIKEIDKGNKIDPNSHTSILYYYNIKPKDQDKWDKWEYTKDTLFLDYSERIISDTEKHGILNNLKKILEKHHILDLKRLYEMSTFLYYEGYAGNTSKTNRGWHNKGMYNYGSYNIGDFNRGMLNVGCFNRNNYSEYYLQEIPNFYFCHTDKIYQTAKNPFTINKYWAFDKEITVKTYRRLKLFINVLTIKLQKILEEHDSNCYYEGEFFRKLDKKTLNNLVRYKCFDDEIFKDIIGFSLLDFLASTRKRKRSKSGKQK